LLSIEVILFLMGFDPVALFSNMLIIHPLAHLIELLILGLATLLSILLTHHHLILESILMLPNSQSGYLYQLSVMISLH
jgi:hypothetical protein